ncbi:hypothetical protein Ancab_031293 [Ancistrocladus abbreviatus]
MKNENEDANAKWERKTLASLGGGAPPIKILSSLNSLGPSINYFLSTPSNSIRDLIREKRISSSLLSFQKVYFAMTHILFCLFVGHPFLRRIPNISYTREKDRERAQARGGNKGKKAKEDGLTPEQRRERDAKALQEKAAKKAAQAEGGGDATKKK